MKSQGDRYISMLTTLISQPSVSATGEGLGECATLVSELLEDVGLRTQLYQSGSGPVVVGVGSAEAHATLMFYNHYDVQPPEPLDRWVSDPFKPRISDGKIYGRGAADNKGSLVARIAALDTVLATLGELPINVKFVVEGGEEVGSPGLERFVMENREGLFADGCIWEYGYVDRRGSPVINLGVKGMLYVELEASGKELHSSWGGVVSNPAWRLIQALSVIRGDDGRVLVRDFYDDVEAVSRQVEEMMENLDLNSLKPEGVELPAGDTRSMLRRLLLEPACNLCGISAGYVGPGSKTSIPATARVRLDFRLVPNQDPEKILSNLLETLKSAGLGDITVRKLQGYPASRTSPDSYLVGLVGETAKEAYGVEPTILPSGAASGPMHLFEDFLGIPCVSTGVGHLGSNVHGPNENIRIEDFLNGIKHIALVMASFHSYFG
ncbi:MAG: M20/M25/M40 family metallo-hydrolase [Nitrososphaerota archaeon]